MNKQIKELYTQVCMEQNLPFTVEYNSAVMLDAFADKFAELIIRECVGVVEGGSFLHDQAPTAIFARECSGAIKRHFGVEE